MGITLSSLSGRLPWWVYPPFFSPCHPWEAILVVYTSLYTLSWEATLVVYLLLYTSREATLVVYTPLYTLWEATLVVYTLLVHPEVYPGGAYTPFYTP